MKTTRALRFAGLVLSMAAGVILIGGPAHAAAPDETAPTAVSAWFAQDTARTAADVLADKAVNAHGADDTPVAARNGYSAGTPRRLHAWGPGVLADDSSNFTTPTDEWVAALLLRGRVIGTIAAAIDPAGIVRFTYLDDDAAAGAALAAEPSGKIVRDPQLGGLAAVTADGSATGLSTYTATALGNAKGRDALREKVRKAHDRSSWDTGDSGAGSPSPDDGSAASFWPGALIVAIVGGLVVAFIGRRSRAGGHPSMR